MDPFENSVNRLATKFGCSPLHIKNVAPMKERQGWLQTQGIGASDLDQDSERKYKLLRAVHYASPEKLERTRLKKEFIRNVYRDTGHRLDTIVSGQRNFSNQ